VSRWCLCGRIIMIGSCVGERAVTPGLVPYSATKGAVKMFVLSDVDAELEEFAVDSGSTPQGIGCGHSSDQGLDRGVDGRTARRGAPGERGPVSAKATSLPAQDGGGSHDDEGLPPGGPHP
jgi:hypothetical protein